MPFSTLFIQLLNLSNYFYTDHWHYFKTQIWKSLLEIYKNSKILAENLSLKSFKPLFE